MVIIGIDDGAREAFDRSTCSVVLFMRLMGNLGGTIEGTLLLLFTELAGKRAVRGVGFTFTMPSVDRGACAAARAIFSRGSVRDSVRRGRASEGRLSGRRISVTGASIGV